MWKSVILALTVTAFVAAEEAMNLTLIVTSSEDKPSTRFNTRMQLPEPTNYSFTIDYMNDQFLLDRKPFQYVSGSFHYFRTPNQYWRDRLRKLRAAGLNAVSTYVEWSFHQPDDYNSWNWYGDADLPKFLTIAQEEDLLVILRPGPYICAERDLGGFPTWLLTRIPDIRLRTSDERYMRYVERYLHEVFEKVKPFLRGNGGPIIMVQVENEYGSYSACDTKYMDNLREIFSKHVGNDALLYTTDGASAAMLRCGLVPGAYATVDFGATSNVTKSFEFMRLFQPRGPLVNSEFYPGWLTHWEEPFQTVDTEHVTRKLDEMLALGASVNFYMFYGGTNFGFTAGANGGSVFSPQITSYDYDAPLTEAGDPTDKYFRIRDVVAKYFPLPNMSLPVVSKKGDYGTVTMKPVIGLLDHRGRRLFGTTKVSSATPPTFEEMGLAQGLMLYETHLPRGVGDPAVLNAVVKDRALVYANGGLVGTLSRTRKIYTIPLEDPYGRRLALLVENQGHLNYGDGIEDFKGIWNATINDIPLSSWNSTGFALNNIEVIRDMPMSRSIETVLHSGPLFLRGNFTVESEPLDTYLDTTGWGKGVAFINGRNLGRYWPLAGPQMTLYVPAPYLRTGYNDLVLLELEYVPRSREIKFQTVPNMSTNLNATNLD